MDMIERQAAVNLRTRWASPRHRGRSQGSARIRLAPYAWSGNPGSHHTWQLRTLRRDQKPLRRSRGGPLLGARSVTDPRSERPPCPSYLIGTGSGTGVAAGWSWASPRLLAARIATSAAAARKMLLASKARANPEVSASGRGLPPVTASFVLAVATAEKIANPTAPPSCCEALSSAAASPARSGGTLALAAVVIATNAAPRPNEEISRPGSRSVR